MRCIFYKACSAPPEIMIAFVVMISWEDCWKLNNKKHVFVHDISFLDNQQPQFPGIGISVFISIGFQK